MTDVNGSQGQASAGLADKARALYGDRYAEFLDRVQAFAYYPYAVLKEVADFRDGEISMRFEGLSGRIDQGAGILFDLKLNGDYLTLRANCLENNLVFVGIRKGAAIVRQVGQKYTNSQPTMARSSKFVYLVPRSRAFWTASSVPLTHAARACLWPRRCLVQGRQPHGYFADFAVLPAVTE